MRRLRKSLWDHKSLTHRTSTRLTTPCGVCFRSKFAAPRSRTSTNWNDASTASGPLWVTRLLNVLLANGVSVYSTRLHSCWRRIFWACCSKDDVMWHVWLFWETITACHVRRYSVNHSNVHLLIYCVGGWIWHSEFPKIVQAHTLGGHFRHSFVKGLFRDDPSNFYWNRFIFDRYRAKGKLAQFLSETRCILCIVLLVIGSKSLYCIHSGGRGGVFWLYLPQTWTDLDET